MGDPKKVINLAYYFLKSMLQKVLYQVYGRNSKKVLTSKAAPFVWGGGIWRILTIEICEAI